MSSEHPTKKFFGALSSLGNRLEEFYGELPDEGRRSFGEIFSAYSSLIEATEQPNLAIGRRVSDAELRQLLNDTRKSFKVA
jgi:hypothetical protein